MNEIAKRVEDYFSDNGSYRSQLGAKTETISASNCAQVAAAKQSDVPACQAELRPTVHSKSA